MKNLVALATLIFPVSGAIAQNEIQQTSGVGFNSVAEAMATLKEKPGVSIITRSNDQWIIINEKGGQTNWSFAPVGHYAYPAVVKREIKVNEQGKLVMQTRALCDSGIEPCQRLIGEFNESNRRAYESTQKGLGKE